MSATAAHPVTAPSGAVIQVNDQPRALTGATSLSGIMADLGLAERKGVAVAVNGDVVPRSRWPAHALRDGDRVLVIRATQGG
jgi:sulfur carrier protein